MTTTRWTGPGAVLDPAALADEVDVHRTELELQDAELQHASAELRRINDDLLIAHARVRALYELAPTPYITVDGDRTIVDLNRAAEATLGAPRDRLLGGPIDRFVDDACRARFGAFVDGVFTAGHARGADVVLIRADAPPIDVVIDGVALREAANDPLRCVLALVDVTARERAEGARRRAQDAALVTVAHDLRGPLNAIGLACDALASGLTPEEHRTCVAAIERSAARCEALIRDLLASPTSRAAT